MARVSSKTTLAQIQEMAEDDGYAPLSRELAAAIKRACLRGSCVWTREKIVTVDDSRITLRPGHGVRGRPRTERGRESPRVQVRLSEAEKERLDADAANASSTPAELLRRAYFGGGDHPE